MTWNISVNIKTLGCEIAIYTYTHNIGDNLQKEVGPTSLVS
jgi:GH25 family lysozyme M1 (1,4-beta-N-acetylmuramidase)